MQLDKALFFPSLLVLALAFLASCGGSSGNGDAVGDGTGNLVAAVKVESGTVPDEAILIDQKNLKFQPRDLTVSSGDTIYFRNSEGASHTVTINGRNVTGAMGRNEVMTWIPPGPGTYKFTCDYHPQMKATVTVE